jgi:hypothetical protein
MIDKNYWKITEFAQMVGKSLPTVDKWFRELEKRGIHYIQRVEAGEGEEKVYDDLDLQIGHFVVAQREKKWSLDAIFEALKDEFDLRPFPEERKQSNSQAQMIDVDAMKKEIALAFEEMASAAMIQLRKEIRDEVREELKKELIQSLPKPIDPLEERNRRLTEHITQRRIESVLREEALRLWNQKPESEKMKKTGWFQKGEDRDKRDQFVQSYIDEHYEQRLKEEYGFDKK